MAARDRLTSECNSTGGETRNHDEDHRPFRAVRALAGRILILFMPRLFNYVVAAYLILVGAIGLSSIYHFIR